MISLLSLALAALALVLPSTIEARCVNPPTAPWPTAPWPTAAKAHCSGGAVAVTHVVQVSQGGHPVWSQKEALAHQIDLSSAKVPLSNGTPILGNMSPPTGTLMTVLHGTGTQNYSCPSAPSATPSLVGANATLQSLASTGSFGIIGHHFFNAAGNPTFDLTTGLLETSTTHLSDVVAPVKGAVDWLKLGTDGAGWGGLQEVYRVNTTGGKPAAGACDGKPAGYKITVPYSAFYWFYGSGS